MQDLIPICGITNIRRYATDGDFTYSETGSLQTQFRERDPSRAATFSHIRFANGSRADKGSDGIDASRIIAWI